MEGIEQQEPIFELATECENLFATQISRINNDDQNATKLLSDVYQRFAAWAAFLGVFAEANVCLDRRLRRHIEIQDLVLRLLDIMQINLSCLFDGDTEPSDKDAPVQQHVCVNMESLGAITGALERLNQLGAAIRRSSVTSQTSRARKFAENFDLTSFEQVGNVFLRALYPDASDGLIELLTQSMTENYALFLHRKSRKERLQVMRLVSRARTPLRLIAEEPLGASDGSQTMDIDLEALPVHDGLSADIPRAPPPLTAYRVPQSEPTSVDSQELKARLQRLMGSTARSKPVSILINQAKYPRPAKDSLICEWCFGPLTAESQEQSKWQDHINEDFKPYICLSEKCSESIPRFASSREWFQHMTTTHGENWQRVVHAPALWICPLCTELETTFHCPEGLAEHFHGCHIGIFTEQQMKGIIRQSKFPAPRPQETCPLCCLPIGNGQDPLDTKDNQEGKRFLAMLDDSGSKRLKTDMGYTELSDNTKTGVYDNVTPERKNVTENSTSRNPLRIKDIASHVAAHLQNVMLLTLRLISINDAPETSTGSQSGSSETDSQVSWVGSGPRGLDEEMSYTDGDFLPRTDANTNHDNEFHLTEPVPDSDPINWDDILGVSQDASDDNLVHASAVEALKPPPSSSANSKKIEDRVRPYYEVIRELMDSEYIFGRDMKVVSDIYKATAVKELVPEDIKIIFRNADQVAQFSLDFQDQLMEAARSVFTIPESQLWSEHWIGDKPPFTIAGQPNTSTTTEVDNDCPTIGQTFMAHSTRMEDVYVEYLRNHDEADKKLRTVEKMPSVATWLKKCDAEASDLTIAKDLHTLLARPLHRMLNYVQLLEALLSFTPSEHSDRKSLAAALKEIININVTIETGRHQALVREILRETQAEPKIQNRFFRSLSQLTRRSATAVEGKEGYDPLVQGLVDNFLQVQILVRDIENYMVEFQRPIDSLREIADAIEGFIDVSPTPSIELERKWRQLKISVQDVKSKLVPEHLEVVRRYVLSPTVALLELHDGPQRAIKYRDTCRPEYTRFMAINERGGTPGKRITEQAEKFIALNKTLEHELPKLFSLTAKLAKACLRKLVQIQLAWSSMVQETLRPLIVELPDSTRGIVDDWQRRTALSLADAQVLSLGVCNGSILSDTIVDPQASNPSRDLSTTNNHAATNSVGMTPILPKESLGGPPPRANISTPWTGSEKIDPPTGQDPNLPPLTGREETLPPGSELPVLFVAASLYDFSIDRERREAGYPYLTYISGAIFEVIATKGELWLARYQDDPTHQVGWIWSRHFAKIPASV